MWQFEIKKQKKEKYLQYTMIQAKFWTIGTEQRQVEGKWGFSKCGFTNTWVAMRYEKMHITTADRVARRYIVFTVAKECAFV